MLNEKDVVACVKNAGYEVYNLEDMPFHDQIELFYDAHSVVALHGAGLTNLVFSENVNTLEIFPYRWVKPSYYHLTKSIGGRYQYLVGEGSEIGADVQTDVASLEKKLEQMHG